MKKKRDRIFNLWNTCPVSCTLVDIFSRLVIFNSCAKAHWCATGIFKTCNAYLVRDMDLFSIILSNKRMTLANTTIAIQCEWIKIIPVFFVRSAKNIFWCHRILVSSLCGPWDEKSLLWMKKLDPAHVLTLFKITWYIGEKERLELILTANVIFKAGGILDSFQKLCFGLSPMMGSQGVISAITVLYFCALGVMVSSKNFCFLI